MAQPDQELDEAIAENAQLRQELQTYKRQKQAVDIREQRFSLALRGANDGLWDWDLVTDDVYYSPRWKSMLGFEEHELNNKLDTWASLVHPDEKHEVLGLVREYLSGKRDAFEVEMRMKHKDGHYIHVLSRAFCQYREADAKPVRLIGTHIDITARKNAEAFNTQTAEILKMIALGQPATAIYDAIALLYESRHPGMRCSMLELSDGVLLHGGAPSLPKAYCDAVHGLQNGPNVGSCGASTYTGKRCLVENIETHPNWSVIKEAALPHGLRCCWSEPIISSKGEVLGAFGMYYNYPALPNEEESENLKSAARLASIVMERDHDQKRIRELAYTDSLTAVANRAHFHQYISALIKTSKRQNRSFSLLYIDLDNFKGINDSLGHDAGDELLKQISMRLKGVCRETDFLARLSGDEFCIVVNEMENNLDTRLVVERCFEAVSAPIDLLNSSISPSISIGISHYPDNGQEVSALLKAADTALYSAKEGGKNQFAYYEKALTKKAEYCFLMEQRLRTAIEEQQLTLVYQPLMNAKSAEIFGFEALSRWHQSEFGEVSPNEFIPVAERIGMIKPLTQWVLLTACHQLMAWQAETGLAYVISINISPSHCNDEDLVRLVQNALDETGISATQIQLEVTENITQTDPGNLLVLNTLQQMGVRLAIDDFGTGYSSFASLKHLQVDTLKIDRYFVSDLDEHDDTHQLLGSMIDIGHLLGHSITAEGVENEKQLRLLQKLGCEYAQGFYISKPLSAQATLKHLRALSPEIPMSIAT